MMLLVTINMLAAMTIHLYTYFITEPLGLWFSCMVKSFKVIFFVKELEKKKGKPAKEPVKLTKKQEEMLQAQKDKESDIRKRLTGVSSLERGVENNFQGGSSSY